MNKLKLSVAAIAIMLVAGGAFFLQTDVVEAHTRTVKIKVDKNGFSPSSIDAEAGHKLNLVFNRADKNNCGSVVVFPKQKIRKNLPVGKDVIVSIMPTEAGSINFTCGMGMYKGSIVITD
ncbi:MAG: cupredoxin domain-containing protein [Pyrinomonadaceae bacterium]